MDSILTFHLFLLFLLLRCHSLSRGRNDRLETGYEICDAGFYCPNSVSNREASLRMVLQRKYDLANPLCLFSLSVDKPHPLPKRILLPPQGECLSLLFQCCNPIFCSETLS